MNISNNNNIKELLKEIEKGRQSGEKEGWLSEYDVKNHFKNKINKST